MPVEKQKTTHADASHPVAIAAAGGTSNAAPAWVEPEEPEFPARPSSDPFNPAEPMIPGVPLRSSSEQRAKAASRASATSKADTTSKPSTTGKAGVASPNAKGLKFSAPLWPIYLFLATLVIFALFLRAGVSALHTGSQSVSAAPATAPTNSGQREDPNSGIPTAPGVVASTQELSKPWSGKRFIFHNQLTGEMTPAEVVHLPGGGFWAVSLKEPYGTCLMNYVTDVNVLRDEYQVNAGHPMVVNPCNRSVFDLAEYASAPSGLVRGVVIAGAATRPPIAIEVKVEGSKVVAVRSE